MRRSISSCIHTLGKLGLNSLSKEALLESQGSLWPAVSSSLQNATLASHGLCSFSQIRRHSGGLLGPSSCWQQRQGFASVSTPLQAGETAPPSANPLLEAPPPQEFSSGIPLPQGPAPQKTAHAILRETSISAKKLNEFARLIRRMHLDDALIQCKISPKKSAALVHNVLLSAKANAVNNYNLDPTRLRVDLAHVGKGKIMKRPWYHGRMKTGIRHNYKAQITIVLRESEAPIHQVTGIRRPLLERRRKHVQIPTRTLKVAEA